MPAEMSFIADNTGRAKVTMWEQNIDALTPDSSYSLQNFVVREYKGRKFLSMPREGAEIIPIPDVGPIDTESDSDSKRELLKLFNVQITGVPKLDSHILAAGPQWSHSASVRNAPCSRDSISVQSTSAKLKVISLARPGVPVKLLHAFGKIVQDLAEREDSITQNTLLTCCPVERISFNK